MTGPTALRTALRLLVISGLIAAAWILLTFVTSSPSASAAEGAPAQPSLLGGVTAAVGDTVGALDSPVADVGHTAGGAVQAVTDAATRVTAPVPVVAPVVQAVAPVVPRAVEQVAVTAPVSHVVAPVAQTVDHVVAAVPVVSAVTGSAPVGTVTAPVAQVVDSAIVATAEASTTPVTTPSVPVVTTPPSGSSAPAEVPAAGIAAGDASAAADADASLSTSAQPVDSDTIALLREAMADGFGASTATTGYGSANGSALATPAEYPAQPGQPGHDVPAGPVSATPGGSAASAGASGGAGAADSTRASLLPGLAVSASAADRDDDLPSTPTFETDSSPD
ncbi:hypothetical protein ACPEEZ_09220 [Frigoribacterium sp. 2-23]|uniref:hypothetical protein n=1 Tax=Frigoribacterium sp. 2-23 TaxID=3415006 RepID=UPI003C6EF4D4